MATRVPVSETDMTPPRPGRIAWLAVAVLLSAPAGSRAEDPVARHLYVVTPGIRNYPEFGGAGVLGGGLALTLGGRRGDAAIAGGGGKGDQGAGKGEATKHGPKIAPPGRGLPVP